MSDKPKRKKNKSDIIDYNDTWLFRLYRQLGWDKTRLMKVQAPSEDCLAHLQWLVSRSEYKYTIQTQENHPYQFQVEVTSITTSTRYSSPTYRYTPMGTVVGSIVKDNRGVSKNIIVFRSYPANIWNRLVITLVLLFAICVFGTYQALVTVDVAMSIVAISWLIFVWHVYFTNRNEALELVTAHFLSLPRSASDTKEKLSDSSTAVNQTKLFKQAPQLDQPITLPFDDETASEEQADACKTQK
jgi:hypothetical protein